MTTYKTTLCINTGQPILRVPLTVLYLVEQVNGREELHLLDTAIPLEVLVKLNSHQIEYLVDRAYTILQLQRRDYVG